jgi:hypothetical protein
MNVFGVGEIRIFQNVVSQSVRVALSGMGVSGRKVE